jgi:D-inositol-3-phosphate glycosyltransferase
MKIAMVSEHASPLAVVGGEDAGGQNVHVAALATHLAALGHDVTVHTRREDPTLDRRVPFGSGVTVDHVPAGPAGPVARDELWPYMSRFADDLGQQWAADPPDVVHAHFWMSGAAALWARPVSTPVLQTFHALGTVKRRHQGRADTSPPARARVEAEVAHRVDRIVATCSDEVRELRAMGVTDDRIDVVPCGVDLDQFRPTGGTERRGARYRILTVGRLVPRKGVDDIVRALIDVPDTELVVAGGPDPDDVATDSAVATMRRLARRLGVDDRVVFRGRVARPDMPALFRSSDLVVCAPWYEPFGIVPLEAMACGVPVVASAVGGMLDTVVPGETGALVAPRRPGLLAATIRRLLAAPDARCRMGRAGRQRAEERYGWPQVAAATQSAYLQATVPQLDAWSGDEIASRGVG